MIILFSIFTLGACISLYLLMQGSKIISLFHSLRGLRCHMYGRERQSIRRVGRR